MKSDQRSSLDWLSNASLAYAPVGAKRGTQSNDWLAPRQSRLGQTAGLLALDAAQAPEWRFGYTVTMLRTG